MTISSDIEAAQRIVDLVASGTLVAAITHGQTTTADARIAIAKTIDALKAWDLVLQRGEETAQIVKEGLG
jgi:hypothetical protein